jgi:hypothetical protein
MADLLGEAIAPCITYANNDMDGQIVDFWLDAWPHDKASIRVGGRTDGVMALREGCPDVWVPLVIEIWQKAKVGIDVSGYATHRLNADRWAATKLTPKEG